MQVCIPLGDLPLGDLTLGVETLVYPCFRVVEKTFSIFILVSDFFSKWKFSKKQNLTIDNKVLIYWHLWYEKLKKLLFHYKNLIYKQVLLK